MSEQDINKALGVKNDKIEKSKYFVTVSEKQTGDNSEGRASESKVGDNIAESVLATVAYIFLILGILSSIGWGIWRASGYHGSVGGGLLIFIGGTILSLIMWALMMITVNISNNVRQIKHDLRDLKK